MAIGARRALLRVWRHLPRPLRRWLVRAGAPSFTVGAACVIERADGAVLLVRLTYRRGWGLPGGLVGRREDIADCARREVGEEVGVDVDLVGPPAVVVDSRPQRVDVVFPARLAPGVEPSAARPTSPEITEVRWFSAEDLPALQHEAVSALVALAAAGSGAGAHPGRGGEGAGGADGEGAGTAVTAGGGSDGADRRGRALRQLAAAASRQRVTAEP